MMRGGNGGIGNLREQVNEVTRAIVRYIPVSGKAPDEHGIEYIETRTTLHPQTQLRIKTGMIC